MNNGTYLIISTSVISTVSNTIVCLRVSLPEKMIKNKAHRQKAIPIYNPSDPISRILDKANMEEIRYIIFPFNRYRVIKRMALRQM